MPDSAAADRSLRAEGATPQPTEESQFIQRSEESAVQDLLGSSLEPFSLQGSGAAEPQHPETAAAAAFDPFGDVTDLAQSGVMDGGSAAPVQAALADPFLALERAASAMGPPSSDAQAERDAESELAAFRAELPAAESDGVQQQSTAAPAAEESHLGSAAAAAVAHQPASSGAGVSCAPLHADISSVPEPPVSEPAADDAAQSHSADGAGTQAVPEIAATEDPAAWAASWATGSEDAAVQMPAAAAGECGERSDDAGDADSSASAAVHQPDISADESQKPQVADDAAQPADVVDDAERHPSVPNGLHAAEADAVRTEPVRDDLQPGVGLFAGLDVEAKPVDEGVDEESDVGQSGSAPQLPDDEAQEGGF